MSWTWHKMLVATCVLIVGCAPEATTTYEEGLEAVRSRGKLVMLCVPHQGDVFLRTNLEAGPMPEVGTVDNFVGSDVDLMAGFAERLGVELEIRPTLGSDGLPSHVALIDGIEQGVGDVAAGSLSITEERLTRVDFSIPYYHNRVVVITRASSGIATLADLEGKTASAIAGSSQEGYLKDLGFELGYLHYVDFDLEQFVAVSEGTVDFCAVDEYSADAALQGFSNLKINLQLPVEDAYGVALAKGSSLLEPLNQYLEEVSASGELNQLIQLHASQVPASTDAPEPETEPDA
ncbi:MAG: amino acid ABC transporter substrate-binding protein [bacterium]|nr:amino acid ABC transporter substrate-binding protein [bacterium]